MISILLQPFMTKTPAIIWDQLGLTGSDRLTWESAGVWGGYPEDAKVNKGEVIFPRIDVKKELEELEKMVAAKSEAPKEEKPKKDDREKKADAQPEMITIDDFAKLDLRVAKVLDAEKVEGADKLLKLRLEVGDEVRQVVSGIAKHYSPQELIGKSVILVANLKPVKLKGIESRGMILAAVDDNDLVLVTVDKAIKSGSKIS